MLEFLSHYPKGKGIKLDESQLQFVRGAQVKCSRSSRELTLAVQPITILFELFCLDTVSYVINIRVEQMRFSKLIKLVL
jgi:hypothetical protein